MIKTKILHITFDMTIGGTQQVIRQLVENIDSSKFSADIVCIDNRLGDLGALVEKLGINVHLLNRQQGFDYSLIFQLRKLIKKNHYDLIHCHQYSPYVYGLLASIFSPAKVIFTEHGRFYPDYGTWKRKLLNPIFSIFTSQITTISQATKDALVVFENFKREDISVIYNGVIDKSDIDVNEDQLKAKFNIPSDAFIFGTISRLQPIKNQKMMIRAFKEVNEKEMNTHLLIVGDGEMKNQLTSLVKELNLIDKVTFTGFQNNPYQFHKIIDVFLLSSFSEGASMTLIEAMSFSKPCVVTNVGGNAELIIDSVNGVVVENDNKQKFAKGMLLLINDKALYKKCSLQARVLYESTFTVKKMVTDFEAIINKQLN